MILRTRLVGQILTLATLVPLAMASCSDGATPCPAVDAGAPVELVSIDVTPADPSLAAGTTQQLTATGRYSDGSQVNVTSAVVWSSDTAASLTVDTAGLATAVAPGSSTVAATLGDVAGSTTVTVTAATLRAITIAPDPLLVPLGLSQQLVATGRFSDGSEQDVTGSVTWTSSAPDTAAVDAGGQVTAAAAGEAVITATDATSGIAGERTAVVIAAELASIDVTPAAPSLAAGTTRQLTATGHYSDGSQVDLSSAVTWSSDTPASVTLDAAGLATAVAPGSSTVTATLGDVAGDTTVTVTAATLQAITITPDPLLVPLGRSQQLVATGHFSDGSPQDLTGSVTWSSSDPDTAAVDAGGLATTAAVGETVITADAGSGISGEATLHVTGPVLESVRISPVGLGVSIGEDYPLVLTGTFSDGVAIDLADVADWSSSAPEILSVSDAGIVTGADVGTSDVTATFWGMSDTVTVTSGIVTALFVSGTQGGTVDQFRFTQPADGDVAAATRTSGLDTPEGLFFDTTHGELWVGSQSGSTVSVVDPDTAQILRQFTTASGSPRSAVYDAGRDLLYVTVSSASGQLNVYENPRALSGGTPTPTRAITDFGGSVYGLFLDAANDRIFVVRTSGGSGVLVFDDASTLSGALSTLSPRTIAAGLAAPRGIVVDTTRDILYVANDGGSVSIFADASTADAPVSATATIAGASTLLLSDTDGVAINPARDELYVATAVSGNRICIYTHASTLTGANDIAPARVLEGTTFGVNGPGGMFLVQR
jgi:uncharacterized protein YjdB